MTKQGAKMSFHANRVETVWEKRIMGLSLILHRKKKIPI